MSHYRSNLRDIEFNLFEALDTGTYLGSGPFANVDVEQARLLLQELERFASGPHWAGSFAAADRTPLELSPAGDVTIPDELHAALEAFYDAGWHLLPLPEHLGGYGAPATIRWAGTELLAGGHAAASLWPLGALMGWITDRIGTEGQRRRFVRPMIERRWGATMVLTEPDAGSDVGAAVTRASFRSGNGPDDLGSIYHLQGIKRFITSADAQTHENTVHLVLARPDGAVAGTKGLSLFLVPKRHVDEHGRVGQRNGVRVASLEHKMGIRGSATCELALGQDATPCVGYLVGDVHDGVAQMFRVIEYARMMVGTKAMATCSSGYLNALEHAKVRVQGTDMAAPAGSGAPKVEIIAHPDVRRMLMEQKAHAEGMRALVSFTGWVQDQARIAANDPIDGAGGGHGPGDHERWLAREDLLLPLVKGYCSEKAFELLSLSLQTFGGSGFMQDLPIEQYLRDAKIDSLYEGTTGIQALDLLFRKILRDRGTTLAWLTERIRETVKAGGDRDPFATERAALGNALEDVAAQLDVLLGHARSAGNDGSSTSVHRAGLGANDLLSSLAEVTIGWLLLHHAEVAHDALDGDAPNAPLRDADRAFYTGKIASARWFARAVLPKVALRRRVAESEDGALMQLPVDAF